MDARETGAEGLAGIVEQVYGHSPQETLFHYTSLAGAIEIIREGSLFASELRYMSDASELAFTAALLERFTDEQMKVSNADPEILVQFKQWLGDTFKQGRQLFVTCFSEEGDLLSQWRGYCPNGKGVCLGFRPADIERAALAQNFRLVRCVYEGDAQNRLAWRMVGEVEARAQVVGPSRDDPRLSQKGRSTYYHVFNSLFRHLILLAAALKSKVFSEEKEWRVVSFRPDENPARIRFREGHSMLVPHIDFELPQTNGGTLRVASARVGPTPHRELAMASMGGLIRTRVDRDYWVMASDIPYRTW
jgi:hypothetical protein